MKALVIESSGESREYHGVEGYFINGTVLGFMDPSGAHIFPAKDTVLHLQPEDENERSTLRNFVRRL